MQFVWFECKILPTDELALQKNSGFSLRDNFIFEVRKWYGYKVVWCQKGMLTYQHMKKRTHEILVTPESGSNKKWFQQNIEWIGAYSMYKICVYYI